MVSWASTAVTNSTCILPKLQKIFELVPKSVTSSRGHKFEADIQIANRSPVFANLTLFDLNRKLRSSLRTALRSCAASCRRSQPSKVTSCKCASIKLSSSRPPKSPLKRWSRTWPFSISRASSKIRWTSLIDTSNSKTKSVFWPRRSRRLLLPTKSSKMISHANKTKIRKRWQSLSVKRMKLRSRRICTFSTWSARSKANSLVKTAFIKSKRLNCRSRLTSFETSQRQKNK